MRGCAAFFLYFIPSWTSATRRGPLLVRVGHPTSINPIWLKLPTDMPKRSVLQVSVDSVKLTILRTIDTVNVVVKNIKHYLKFMLKHFPIIQNKPKCVCLKKNQMKGPDGGEPQRSPYSSLHNPHVFTSPICHSAQSNLGRFEQGKTRNHSEMIISAAFLLWRQTTKKQRKAEH